MNYRTVLFSNKLFSHFSPKKKRFIILAFMNHKAGHLTI